MIVEYFKAILKTLIPTTLVYLGKNESLFLYLKNHDVIIDPNTSIDGIQLTCFSIGLIWTGLLLPIQYEKLKKSNVKQKESFSLLLGQFKETYIKSLKEKLNLTNIPLNTRVFVKRTGVRALITNILWNEVCFDMKEIKGISDRFIVEKLSFVVSPVPEGIIGQSYSKKEPLLDPNVTPDKYKLTKYQKSKCSDVKFCCVAPIYDYKNNIVAMISIDSRIKISLPENEIEIWNELINEYCIILDKFINN